MSNLDNKMNSKKCQLKENNKDKSSKNVEEEIINNIIFLLLNCNFADDTDKFKNEIDDLKFIFKSHLEDNSLLKIIFYKINIIINSSSLDIFQKQNILYLLTYIIEISPKQFYNYTDAILSIFQYFFSDIFSQLFSIISQNFGDMIKLELSPLNNFQQQQKINYESLLLIYDKYKSFCINNIESDSISCQICGTLCLTSFIENCPFIYNNNEKLKKLFEILMKQLDNPKGPAKLEVLNCLTSLIFCSEMQYMPFAKETVQKIIDLCTNSEWIIKKFSLNIICTLMYYFQEEIYPLKKIIIPKLKLLKNENSPEIKELYDQINNNFTEVEKGGAENRISELNYLNIDEISSVNSDIEKNKLNKDNKNFDFVFINYDNHLVTEPININNNNNNIDKNFIINNIKNSLYSPNKQKKFNLKINNKTDFKADCKISRSKSFGQKNILKLKENKNKPKDIKIQNKIARILYYNAYKSFQNNNFKADSKNNSKNKKNFKKKINNNNSSNNTRIAVNNRFFFIKNYSLMFKSNILKKKDDYNKSFSIKGRNFMCNDKKQKNKLSKVNDINMTDNVINEYSTIINNNNFNSFRKITPQQSFYTKLNKKKIGVVPVKMLKEGKNKNIYNNENYVNIIKKIKNHDYIFKPTQKNMNRFNRINDKQKSVDKNSNNKSNKKRTKKKYTDMNFISRNIITTFKNSSQVINNEKLSNISLNNKNITKRNNIIHHEYKGCTTGENKSLWNDSIGTSRKSSFIFKKNKKMEKKLIPMGSSTLKKKNHHKIINKCIKSKNSKEKTRMSNSPQNILYNPKMSEFEKERNKGKSCGKEIKPSQIKSIKSRKTAHLINQKKIKCISKNNSISISNKNNDISKTQEENLNIKNNDYLFKKMYENKKTIKLNKEIKNNDNIYSKKSKFNLENEFKRYKQDTNRLIYELKNKVDELEKTICDYENDSKNKEKLKEFVKNNQFIEAFNYSINSKKVNNVYYVIKKYNSYENQEKNENKCKLNSEILTKIINILCQNIYSCENLNIVFTFIINNIYEKKIKIENDTCKLFHGILKELYDKRKNLCLSDLDIDNIKCLIDYFYIN